MKFLFWCPLPPTKYYLSKKTTNHVKKKIKLPPDPPTRLILEQPLYFNFYNKI